MAMDSKRDLENLTLGTLSELSSRVCLPSTLSYAERMHLQEHDPIEYTRIYNTPSRQKPVWQRLEADAVTRRNLPTKQYSFWSGHGPENNEGGGYSQSVSFKQLTRPSPGAKQMVDPPVESLHRITLDRYRQKYPLEFYSAIRPNTETVSQTLRFLGTYACDVEFAENVKGKYMDA